MSALGFALRSLQPILMGNPQADIVHHLMASYREIGGINHFGSGDLPAKGTVAQWCEDLLQLLFPTFFAQGAISADQLQAVTASRVESLAGRLRMELQRVLRLDPKQETSEARVQSLVDEFLLQLPAVRQLLRSDVQAAFDGDPAARSFEEIILAYPGLEAIAIQRSAHLLHKAGVPLLPRMMTEWVHGRTGIDIHPGAEIGSHFFIDHGTGVVIGETCRIGSHVKLYQGVGLVAKSLAAGQALSGTKRHPTIEDHVTIYAGATIVGGDTVIGARSVIGANVFLMQSVAPDMVYALGDQEHRIRDRQSRSGKPAQKP